MRTALTSVANDCDPASPNKGQVTIPVMEDGQRLW
jgi:hypothetical protein